MTTLVVGATGATGKWLVKRLLDRGESVRAIVRSKANLPEQLQTDDDNLTLIEGSVLDMSDDELTEHVKGCDAVASCLGHNLTFKGVYGHPRHLVTDAARRLTDAIRRN
jgi:nucleoside-diphosphate-sugar epimerase